MSDNSEFLSHHIGNKPHIIQGTVEYETDVLHMSEFPQALVEELLDTTIYHHKRVIVECPNIKMNEEDDSYVGIRGLVVSSDINTDKESYRLVIDKLEVRVNPNGRKIYNPVETVRVVLGGKGFVIPREIFSKSVATLIRQHLL